MFLAQPVTQRSQFAAMTLESLEYSHFFHDAESHLGGSPLEIAMLCGILLIMSDSNKREREGERILSSKLELGSK